MERRLLVQSAAGLHVDAGMLFLDSERVWLFPRLLGLSARRSRASQCTGGSGPIAVGEPGLVLHAGLLCQPAGLARITLRVARLRPLLLGRLLRCQLRRSWNRPVDQLGARSQ